MIKVYPVEFKIDQFTLKHAKDAEAVTRAYHAEQGRDLGLAIIKDFPFLTSDKSYRGELPVMSMTKDHEFQEVYERQFVVMDVEDFEKLKQQIR